MFGYPDFLDLQRDSLLSDPDSMTSSFLWPLLAVSMTATGAPMPEALGPAPCETGIFRHGQAISLYLFPQADHGMRSYAQAPDGTRKPTVITPGFYDLMADWAKGRVQGNYGQAYRK
nr:hypothetical protein [uncultured Janthinobacterium sp.]